MGPPYENVYIGTFLFSLGFAFRARNPTRASPVSIDLYQQTRKGEQLVGDLLTSVGGKVLIIEFKRSCDSLNSELKKPNRANLRALLSEGHDMRFADISRRCHFLAFASVDESGTQCLFYKPYSEMLNEAVCHPAVSDEEFISKYLDMNSFDVGVQPEDFKYYLLQLKQTGGGSCGGLAVSVGEDGIRSFVAFQDLGDLEQGLIEAEQIAEGAKPTPEAGPEDEMTFGGMG